MKRLNPNTNAPFKMGDIREDKYIFRSYKKSIRSNGYFKEVWEEEKLFFLRKTKRKLYSRERQKTATGRAKHMLGNCRNSSKKRNIEYKLVLSDIFPAVEAGVCQITGIPFDFSPHPHKKLNPYAPSVDRIDNERGYVVDNVRVVLWLVNSALSECSDEEALPILKALVNALEKNVKQNQPTPVPENHLGQSQTDSQLRTVPRAGSRQDCDGAHHHTGEPKGKDIDYRTQASCRICVGTGMFSVGSSECHEMLLSNGVGNESIEDTAERLGCVCYQCGECSLVD